MHPAPRSVRSAIPNALVLVGGLLLFPPAVMAGPGPSRASTDATVPSGFVVVIRNNPQKDQALDLRALNNPFISGVASRRTGTTSSPSREGRIGRGWINCSLLQNF
jgi:hypothetical protein